MRLRLPIALAAVLLFAGFGGSAQKTQPLFGLVSRSAESMALVRLDPLTLVPHGTWLSLGDRYQSWSFAPDRSKVVFGDSSRGELLLVDAKRMRRIAVVDSQLQTAAVVGTSWPAADRIYAVLETLTPSGDYDLSCCGPAELVTVDPVARKVLATRPLDGQVYGVEHAAGELVLLLGPIDAVGAGRLVVVGHDGGVRSFAIDGLTVGQEPFPETEADAIVHFAQPGLALAPDGSRAYLVTPDRAIEVDLATGAASSHPLAAGRALQKSGAYDGSWRTAAWARPGVLVVTGTDDHASIGADGHVKLEADPAGAAFVDTRDWSVRVVDATATDASVGSDGLAVSGFGLGATIYGLDGSRRARLFGRQYVGVLALGRRAFVQTQAGGWYAVVSLRTGAILRKVHSGELPQPLLGAGADS